MSVKKTAVTCASAACLAMVLPAVKKSEGYWPTVKVDRVGTGTPCTGGYGETEGVRCGETHTEKFWSDRLARRLTEYDQRIGACIHVDAPDSVRAAAITTSYNAGTGAVCGSPMVARINARNFRAACAALLTSKIVNGKLVYTGWYITAQHRVLQGLIKRRRDDQKMCFAYLKGPAFAAKAVKDNASKRYEEAKKVEADKLAEERAALEKPMAAPPSPPPPKKHWWSWVFK